MVKKSETQKRMRITTFNVAFALVRSVVGTVLLGLFVVKDADALVELGVGLVLGSAIAIVAGWIARKSLVITLLITTATLVVVCGMVLAQMDFSGI